MTAQTRARRRAARRAQRGAEKPRYYTSIVVYRLLRGLIRVIMAILYRWDVVGTDNVPAEGAVMLTVNHLHLLDPFAVAPNVKRQIVTLVAAKWQDNWFIDGFLRGAGSIYVRRGQVDRQALRDCQAVIENGGVLAVAPEGTRSRSGVMQEAKPGVGYLISRRDVTIVPVAYWGIERLPEWKLFCHPTCHVSFGKPYRLPRPEGHATSEDLARMAEAVMVQIALLLPESYRGHYAQATADYAAGKRPDLEIIPVE